MPTIDELRTKWFLNFQGGGAMLPVLGYPARHAGTAVTDFTDANLITALIDGKAFMEQWHRAIRELIALPNPAASEVWHANWSTNDVRTLGYRNPASDARQVLFDAHSAGIQLRGLLSAHVGKEIFTHNIRMIDWLSQHGISTFFLDDRFPPSGSIHQKFTCIRRDPANTKSFLGSGDISTDRWDLNTHPVFDPDRNPMNPTPTHDVGVLIQGPAVADIETTFKERWNDPVNWRRAALASEDCSPSKHAALASWCVSFRASGAHLRSLALRQFVVPSR
jgi:phosphatidylserine/phosphatidylglycerophosphate/cardiolipin synthase-like enzyme